MNELLWAGGGALAAYVLMRGRDAHAATRAPSCAPPPVGPLPGAAQSVSALLPIPEMPPATPVRTAGTTAILVPPGAAVVPASPSAPLPAGASIILATPAAPVPSGTPPTVSAPVSSTAISTSPVNPPSIVQVPGLSISVAAPTPERPAPPRSASSAALIGRWGWPVPQWQGRAPVISDGFGSVRPSQPGGKHRGVDIMFARTSGDPFPIGSPNGTRGYVMPDSWMAVAGSNGLLWSAKRTARGYAVVIDHGTVATFYTHMEQLFVPETTTAPGTPREARIPIRAGQPLGVIGADPLDGAHLKHLHFELWLGGPDAAIDPAPLMKSWEVFGASDVLPFLDAAPRNARSNSTDRKRAKAAAEGLVWVSEYTRAPPYHALHREPRKP